MALRAVRLSQTVRLLSWTQTRAMSDIAGSGSGKGGGAGGDIRESGGAFGRREAALENQYFRKQQEEQLKALRESIKDEISHHSKQIEEHKQEEQLEALKHHHHQELQHHQDQIKTHQEAIDRHKSKLKKLKDMADHD